MAADTICGVFINAFKERPTMRELGRLVAHLSIAEQADFLMEFADALADTTAYIHRAQRLTMLAETLVAKERAVEDGKASDFILKLGVCVEAAQFPDERDK